MATKYIKYRLSVEFYDPDVSADAVWSRNFGLRTLDSSGGNFHSTTQTIGTSEEALTLGETSGDGVCIVENTEPSTGNFVEIRLPGTGAGNDSVRVDPGQVAMFRLGSDATAPYAVADTAAVNIRLTILPVA